MKSSILSLVALVTAVTAQIPTKGCTGNNCNRAVFGTFRSGTDPTRSAQCASFLSITVTPATTTTTVTQTVTPVTLTTTLNGGTVTTTVITQTFTATTTASTETDVVQTSTTVATSVETDVVISSVTLTTITTPVFAKRQATLVGSDGATTVRPTSIPAYASACSGIAAFSTACLCGGVTLTTTTVASPTATAYATVTVTAAATATTTATTLATVKTTVTSSVTLTTVTTNLALLTELTTTATTTIATSISVTTAAALPLATLYQDYGYGTRDLGPVILTGYPKQCINLPSSFVKQASAIKFSTGTASCSLYPDANCGGTPSVKLASNDNISPNPNSAFPQQAAGGDNDTASSAKCYLIVASG